jgi:hypothetical protein
MSARNYGSFGAEFLDSVEQQVIDTSAVSTSSKEHSRTRAAVTVAVTLSLLALPLLYSSATKGLSNISSSPITGLFTGKPLMKSSRSSAVGVDFETYFALVRKGYGSLTHFGSGRDDVVRYAILDSYNTLIEPYADMEFVINSEGDVENVVSIKYNICSVADETECVSGEFPVSNSEAGRFSVPCDAYDQFTLSIEGYDSAKQQIVSSTGSAICLYVRREMKALTEEDLEATLDAMHTLWTFPENEGQKKYGTYYHDAKYFTTAHHFNAGQQESDHIHEGVGFLAQHIKLTNAFEKAMQAVDPRISLP